MKIPYLSHTTIREKAEQLLAQFGLADKIPTDVELLVERDLKLDITPIPGFRNKLGVDGMLSQDRTTIYVDENVQRNVVTRYRFTLAHEIGHLILHGDVIEAHLKEVGDEPLMLWEMLSKEDYEHAERQANVFAAALLMPLRHIEDRFRIASNKLETAKTSFEELDSQRKMMVVRVMSGDFGVSPDALRFRLMREGLINEFENPEKTWRE